MEFTNTTTGTGGIQFVTELPTTVKEYAPAADSANFQARERCTVAAVTDEATATVYERITAASNAGNKYCYAVMNLSELTTEADTVTVDMEYKMPSSRWFIGIGDLSQRPGTSYRTTYDYTTGLVISHGTKDGKSYCVNNVQNTNISPFDMWVRMKTEIDVKRRIVKYTLYNRDTGAVIYSDTADFADTTLASITGIELYSWTPTQIDIGKITVTASRGAKEGVIYAADSGNGYSLYAYKDGEPQLISSQAFVNHLLSIMDTKADKQTVTGGFAAGRNAEVSTVEGTQLKYYYIGQWKEDRKITYVSGNPKALYDGDNTGEPVNSDRRIFNVFDLGQERNISTLTMYVPDKGANTTNMVDLSNVPPVTGSVRKAVLRTNGQMQNKVPIIENKLSTDGYIKVGYTNGRYIGKYRYISVYDWSNTCTASEIYAETDTTETPIPAIQLGEGKNENPYTFQVYNYQMMDENGKIPIDRLPTELTALMPAAQPAGNAEEETQ